VTLTPRTLFIDCSVRPVAQPRQSPLESVADVLPSGVGPSVGFMVHAAVIRLGRAIHSGKKSGAAEGTRTPDPIITNDVLYQLSYSGVSARIGPKLFIRRSPRSMRHRRIV
jgi:hypothetical protein